MPCLLLPLGQTSLVVHLKPAEQKFHKWERLCFCECKGESCSSRKCARSMLPPAPQNGYMYVSCMGEKCMPGVIAIYYCKKGYVIRASGVSPGTGSHEVTCDWDGSWRGQLQDLQCVPSPEGFVLGFQGQSCDDACYWYGLACEVRSRMFSKPVWAALLAMSLFEATRLPKCATGISYEHCFLSGPS